MNGWMDEENVVYRYTQWNIYIHNGIYIHHGIYIHNGILAIKKEWNLAICNHMDGTREYYSKWNESVRERQSLYNLTHMCNLRNKAGS